MHALQVAESMVLTGIPEISVLKARNKPSLFQGKIRLPVEKIFALENVSNRK